MYRRLTKLHPTKVRLFLFSFWPALLAFLYLGMTFWAPPLDGDSFLHGPGVQHVEGLFGAAAGLAWLVWRRSPYVVMSAVSVMFAVALSRTLGIVTSQGSFGTQLWLCTVWVVIASAEVTIGSAALYRLYLERLQGGGDG